MKRKIIDTQDGSHTILIEDWGESFHSNYGAIQEAQHVYIKNGFEFSVQNKSEIHILEIGFGTGLNCFLTYLENAKFNLKVFYTGVEGFPLSENEWKQLNYKSFFSEKEQPVFDKIHALSWEKEAELSERFYLTKKKMLFQEISFETEFDLVYFDAFGFQYQPELWSKEIFENIKKALKPNGVIVTYACKGEVNRILKGLGFKLEKLQGPPGKREMTRAVLI